MVEILDLLQDFNSPYQVSFPSQFKFKNDKAYGKSYISKVCSYCGKTGHVIDTCYKKYRFYS